MKDAGMRERDVACLLLPHLDYDAQLVAIRDLIWRHRQADDGLASRIREIDAFARRCSASQNERAVDEWLETMHASTYQGAAHSMAAVGMLAPLMESIFFSIFQELRDKPVELSIADARSGSSKRLWDCHFVFKDGKHKRDLVRGILQLAGAVNMRARLPSDLGPTLQALFEYRNKMFHCGFEWPKRDREQFQVRITAWPKEWFSMATRDNEPWIFYLTDAYIDHCLKTVEDVIAGIGAFCTRELLPRLHGESRSRP